MKTAALALLAAFALLGPAAADEIGATIVFSADEIRIISAYYRDTPAERDVRGNGRRLPRGIAKNLARGKSLPPGLAKRYLPPDLVERLPPPPAGHERIVVAGKILLVEIATQAVRDVLTDILFD